MWFSPGILAFRSFVKMFLSSVFLPKTGCTFSISDWCDTWKRGVGTFCGKSLFENPWLFGEVIITSVSCWKIKKIMTFMTTSVKCHFVTYRWSYPKFSNTASNLNIPNVSIVGVSSWSTQLWGYIACFWRYPVGTRHREHHTFQIIAQYFQDFWKTYLATTVMASKSVAIGSVSELSVSAALTIFAIRKIDLCVVVFIWMYLS